MLPNHLHAVWQMEEGDTDYRTRWRLIETAFTRALPAAPAGRRPGERGVWQRCFFERWLRDDRQLGAAIDYTHDEPVRHGLVSSLEDWPPSTWQRPRRP